ncbi:peptide deformylase [Chloroflexota bacterium]
MAILPIRTLPDPVLRQKAKKVRNIDNSVKKLIADMLETMHADPGRAGLAAPQVGISLRVIVIGIPEQEDIVLINPEIVKRNGERFINEGCLSIPGYFGEVKRAKSVTAKGRDQNWKEVRIKAEDLLAQALEHEIDHLNGLLYIDHLDSINALQKVEVDAEEDEP